VIRPRFADAQFFFDEDVKQGLDSMASGLANVTYQQKLGSYADKTARVQALAVAIASALGVDADDARRAAQLAKADLQSRLVGEFPELQGVAGRYYATAAGLPGDVADAIDHAYQPRFAGDAIAQSRLGQVLAIAERLDTLAGGFVAGLKPTGNKDPFSLRRTALGLARTVIEGGHDLDVWQQIYAAAEKLDDFSAKQATADAKTAGTVKRIEVPTVTDEAYAFLLERLRAYYADKGVTAAQFDAVAEREGSDGVLLDFDRRLRAVRDFAALPEADALAAANKRIRNILRKTDEAIPAQVDAALLREPAEQALASAVDAALAATETQLAARDYVGVLRGLAALRAPVDAFFDGVMVMADDTDLRGNRLALLKRLADRFAAVAAIERLASG
jgi:glycyl-tRNA synthetase beta chain